MLYIRTNNPVFFKQNVHVFVVTITICSICVIIIIIIEKNC